MSLFKRVTQESLAQLQTSRYHYISNGMATKALQSLEEARGKLSKATRLRVETYSIEVLGWKGYAPWLLVYSHVAGHFKEGWIPDNFYGSVVIPKIQGDYGKVSFLKPLTNRLFQQEICPDLGYCINRVWFDCNFKPIKEELVTSLFFSETTKVICKLDRSHQGKDIYVFDQKAFTPNAVMKLGNGVVQKFIQQHDFFNAFVAGSVATIRLTTVVDQKGVISLRAAYLRLAPANHTHVQSNTQIRIPIALPSGQLHDLGYLPNWKQIAQHPDTGQPFAQQIIPHYLEAVHLVLKLHLKIPMVQVIGWDLIIDAKNNPVIMEWNGYSNDIKFSEATQGPCFKDLGWNVLRK